MATQTNPEVALKTTSVTPSTTVARRGTGWTRQLIVIGLVALVLVVGVLYWLTRGEAPTRYTTVPVDRGAVTQAVTATGTVNPILTIIVGSYVSGVIQTVNCDFNTKVTKGQSCAQIDPRPYQMTVDQE
jgi:HlyD family secretion protein